jgi:hypothetical protein
LSGETEKNISGWTVDTLKEHFEARLNAQRTAMEAAFAASEKAILKAEAAAERRFESVNEFRGQLTDQTRTFLPRETFESIVGQWGDWRAQVDARLNQTQGAGAGTDRVVGYLLGGACVVVAVVAVVANQLGG